MAFYIYSVSGQLNESYAGLGSRKPWEELKVDATRDVRHLMADLQAAMTLQPVQPLVPTEPVRPARKAASDF